MNENIKHIREILEHATMHEPTRIEAQVCVDLLEHDLNERRCSFYRLTGDLLAAIATANADGKSGYDTLAQDDWENVLRLAECVRQEMIGAAQ